MTDAYEEAAHNLLDAVLELHATNRRNTFAIERAERAVIESARAWADARKQQPCVTHPVSAEGLPPMPEVFDRGPYDDDDPDGYLEGNRDWARENGDVIDWLVENHEVIRAALKSAPVNAETSEPKVVEHG